MSIQNVEDAIYCQIYWRYHTLSKLFKMSHTVKVIQDVIIVIDIHGATHCKYNPRYRRLSAELSTDKGNPRPLWCHRVCPRDVVTTWWFNSCGRLGWLSWTIVLISQFKSTSPCIDHRSSRKMAEDGTITQANQPSSDIFYPVYQEIIIHKHAAPSQIHQYLSLQARIKWNGNLHYKVWNQILLTSNNCHLRRLRLRVIKGWKKPNS